VKQPCTVEWLTIALHPTGERVVLLGVGARHDDDVSVNLVRWLGCLKGVHHPCVAELELASVAPRDATGKTRVCAAVEHADTSLQEVIYGRVGAS